MQLRWRTSRLVGHVDGLRGSCIEGWAADANAPDVILHVAIVSAEKLVGEWRADLFRADLLAAGFGHGKHAFAVPLAELSEFGKTFSMVAYRPDNKRKVFPLKIAEDVGIEIAKAGLRSMQSINIPDSIRDVFSQVREGRFVRQSGVKGSDVQTFFSDQVFAKTIVAHNQNCSFEKAEYGADPSDISEA